MHESSVASEFRAGNLRAAMAACVQRLAGGSQEAGGEAAALHHTLREAAFLLGHTHAAARLAAEECHRAPEAAIAWADWARFTGGRVPEGELLALARRSPAVDPCCIEEARGFWLLGRGEAAAAARAFAVVCPRHVVAPRRLCWEVSALRMAACQAPLGASSVRRRLLEAARHASRRACAAVGQAPVYASHAAREAAILAADGGEPQAARRWFSTALRHAVEHENLYDFAGAVFERGRVGLALGWPDADENLSDGQQSFRRIGLDASPLLQFRLPILTRASTRVPPALSERFVGVIEAGRRIASCLGSEEVLRAVRAAAVDLLRPQQCTMVLVSADGSRSPRSVDGDALERAIESRTLTIGSGGTLASTLCAPLCVGDRVVACLALLHAETEHFQEEERILASFIVTLGEAALSNAARYQETRTLSVALEARGEALREALLEKEWMLAEINERVRADLGFILELFSLHAAVGHRPVLEAELADITNRVTSIAMLHDFVQPGATSGEVRLDEYLSTLLGHLAVAHGADARRVQLVSHLDEVTTPVATALNLGLIVNELVSNAFEHAFPQRAGNIAVRLALTPSRTVSVTVSDDGTGLAGGDAHPASLGLTLVGLLAERLNGRVIQHAAAGTSVEVVVGLARAE